MIPSMFLTNTTSIHTTFHVFSPLLFCYYFTIKEQALHENHQKSLIVCKNQNEELKNRDNIKKSDEDTIGFSYFDS